MAVYLPPSFYSSVFDSNAFTHSSTGGLTQAEADLLYYHYPVGQAFETLQQTDHTGLATFNAGIDINTGTLKFPDNTVQTTAATAGVNLLPLNNVWTGTNEFQSTAQFDSALIVSNGNQNTSLGNGFLPLAVGQGTQNVFVGVGAGASALCGGGNTVCGYFSASQGMNSASSFNTLYGTRAGQYLTSGVGNTCIGATNCNNNSSGNSNICLGYGAMANESSGSLSNNIVIGNGIQSGASNRIILGDGTQTSMDLKVVSSSTVNMGGKLVMNDATLASRQVSAVDYQLQGLGTGVNNGQIYINGASLNIINNVNSGGVPFYVKDAGGTSATRFVIGSTEVDCTVPYFMTGTLDTDRVIRSCYFQIADNTSPFNNDKQIYSNGTNVVFDNDTNGGGYTFATDDAGGTQSLPLTISSASLLSQCVQPASNDSSTIVPTTAWVQTAITASVGTNLIPANNTWTGTNAFNNVAPITSTATQPASTDNSTKIPTTAWVQGAISGGGLVKPTTWVMSSGNIGSGDILNNGTRQCKIWVPTAVPFQITNAMTARFEFQYSVYGCTAYNSGNFCSTAGTINLSANNVVNNPNTVTQFDMIYGYNGGSTTTAVWRIANVQTTSNYWNTQQTYVPKNATSTSWNFTPLSFSFTHSGTNPNTITFNIGYPQNPTLTQGVGDMMCSSASLRIISSPPTDGQYGDYANDTLTSTNTTGSWYFV